MDSKSENIPNKVVDNIANALDCDMVCFMNPDTFEVEDVPNDVLVGIYYDKGWQEVLARVDQWDRFITIDRPDTMEMMKTFVSNCIPTGHLKKQLHEALALRRPDKRFHDIVDDSDYRDKWAQYHRQQMIQHVKQKLRDGMTEKSSLPCVEFR